MFRLFLLSCFLPTIVVGQGCSVCGQGKKVTNAVAVFTFPGQPSVPCGLLESAGQAGSIPLDQCSFLPALQQMDACECVTDEGGAAAPDSPAVDSTAAPDPTAECSVCGEGNEVTNNEAMFEYPNYPTVPCKLLQQAGQGGQIPLDMCVQIPGIEEINVCECAPILPIPTPMPTPMPVATLPPISETPVTTSSTSDASMYKQTAAVLITLLVGFFGI